MSTDELRAALEAARAEHLRLDAEIQERRTAKGALAIKIVDLDQQLRDAEAAERKAAAQG